MKATSLFAKTVYGLFVGGSLFICLVFYRLVYQRKDLSAQKGISWLFLAAGIVMAVLIWVILKPLNRRPGLLF